jgi:hypothetical protein
MGSLTPGSKLIYERVGNTTYAREFGKEERHVVGYSLPKLKAPLQYDLIETQLWQDIVEAGRGNPSLQKVLDRAILIYQTIKDEHNE